LLARRLANFIIDRNIFTFVSGASRCWTSRRTELHVPVEMNTEAEFFAAVIAAHIRGWAQTVASGR
jgi:hypothetical protein